MEAMEKVQGMEDAVFGPVKSRPPFNLPRFVATKTGAWQLMTVRKYSDGDQRNWPTKPYRPSDEAAYLMKLASAWAEEEGRPETNLNFYLDQLPEGYALFEIDQPGKETGQVYKRLWGHPSGRFFDSIRRFQTHFLWLMKGMQGDCNCVHCNGGKIKPFLGRETKHLSGNFDIKARVRRTHAEMLGENALRRSSSTDGMKMNRTKRLPRNAGPSYAVDEEGNKDVYKECLAPLYKNRGARTGIEDDVFEEDSIDWQAERSSLPIYFTQVEQQHSFVPRIGELVLWCPYFPSDYYLMPNPETASFQFYYYDDSMFHGFPDWRGGLITAVPTSTGIDGPIDFADILDAPHKKNALNSSGFRVETLPDPNDPDDKHLSKQYKYVPLRNIRPAAHWQRLLYGFPQKKLHSSVHNVLKCMATVSVLEKFKFTGDWPNASIHCKGIYLGSELILLGDTIRYRAPQQPNETPNPTTNIMVVTSIRVNLHDVDVEHVEKPSPLLSKSTSLTIIGKAYTSSPTPQSPFGIVEKESAKSLFRPVGTTDFAPRKSGGVWHQLHQSRARYEISHERVLGRLYEADACKMWSGQSQHRLAATRRPSLEWDVCSIIAAREYASRHDARVAGEQEDGVRWFWGDTRVQALDVSTVNGEKVGKYDDVRDAMTLRSWRAQVKLARGDLSAVTDTYLPSRKGRPAGSRVVDGKVVMTSDVSRGDSESDDEADDDDDGGQQGGPRQTFGMSSLGGLRHQSRAKSSSHVMQAARETTDDDEEEEIHDADAGIFEVPESSDEADEITRDITVLLERGSTITVNPAAPPVPVKLKAAPAPKTKQQIMENIETGNDLADDEDSADDGDGDEYAFLDEPPPIRGGTEESEGGDYDPRKEREANEARKRKMRLVGMSGLSGDP